MQSASNGAEMRDVPSDPPPPPSPFLGVYVSNSWDNIALSRATEEDMKPSADLKPDSKPPPSPKRTADEAALDMLLDMLSPKQREDLIKGLHILVVHDPWWYKLVFGDVDDWVVIAYYNKYYPGQVSVYIPYEISVEGRTRYEIIVEMAAKFGFNAVNFVYYGSDELESLVRTMRTFGLCAPLNHANDIPFVEMILAAISNDPSIFTYRQGDSGDYNSTKSFPSIKDMPFTASYLSANTNFTLSFELVMSELFNSEDIPLELKDAMLKYMQMKGICYPVGEWVVQGLFVKDVVPPEAPGPYKGKGAGWISIAKMAKMSNMFPTVDFSLDPRTVSREILDTVSPEVQAEIFQGAVVTAYCVNDNTGGLYNQLVAAMVVICQVVFGIYRDSTTFPFNLGTAQPFPDTKWFKPTDTSTVFDLVAGMAGLKHVPAGKLTEICSGVPGLTSGSNGDRLFMELKGLPLC